MNNKGWSLLASSVIKRAELDLQDKRFSSDEILEFLNSDWCKMLKDLSSFNTNLNERYKVHLSSLNFKEYI